MNCGKIHVKSDRAHILISLKTVIPGLPFPSPENNRRCYCPLHFAHHFYLPFKLSLLCMLATSAFWRSSSSFPRMPLTACTQLKTAAATSSDLSLPKLRSNTPSSFCQRFGCCAKVIISLCGLITCNGKRKISSVELYCSIPIFTANLISRVFSDKKEAIKNLVAFKRSPMSSQAFLKKKKASVICHSSVVTYLKVIVHMYPFSSYWQPQSKSSNSIFFWIK